VTVGAQPEAIVAGSDVVWVAAGGGHDVERIDPARAAVVGRLQVKGSPEGLALDGDRAWVTVHK
jgi:hypothetical protein